MEIKENITACVCSVQAPKILVSGDKGCYLVEMEQTSLGWNVNLDFYGKNMVGAVFCKGPSLFFICNRSYFHVFSLLSFILYVLLHTYRINFILITFSSPFPQMPVLDLQFSLLFHWQIPPRLLDASSSERPSPATLSQRYAHPLNFPGWDFHFLRNSYQRCNYACVCLLLFG